MTIKLLGTTIMSIILLLANVNAQTLNMLGVGERVTVDVRAIEFRNQTNIYLQEGKTYLITVPSTDQWKDAAIATNANGFTSAALKSLEWTRRVPDANWFCLIGELNTFNYVFKIGCSKSVTIPNGKGGTLSLWANDASLAYGNNTGSVRVTIKRTH